MARIHLLCSLCVLFVACSKGGMLTWNVFGSGQRQNNSTSPTLKDYAYERISALRTLRDKLRDSEKVHFLNVTSSGGSAGGSEAVGSKQSTALTAIMKATRSGDDSLGSVFKNIDRVLALAKPLRKMMSSKQTVEAITSMVMPKRDVLKKLLEITGHLEPNLRRYITDKYNWFLTSLIPYSENIGVPPFVLNSMKIPQDFDPRWQLIKSLLDSQGGLDKFIHSVVSGGAFKKRVEVIESRSGDETELISDQEPDASSKAYRKQHQQLYLSAFKKRQMKPGSSSSRMKFNQVTRPSSSLDYENILDQQGQFGHVSYDVRAPEDLYSDAYYSSGSSNAGIAGVTGTGAAASDMDMTMSASGYGGGRGHGGGGGGHGHGGSSYGGLMDPFTILGGLAFLTYLGLLLQNSLNRNNTGRSMPPARLSVIPISLKFESPEIPDSAAGQRNARSVGFHNSKKTKPLTIDQVTQDVGGVWKEIEELKTTPPANIICMRYKLCKLAARITEMNLQPLFSSILISSSGDDEQPFVEQLLRERNPATSSTCKPYLIRKCRGSADSRVPVPPA